MAMSSYFNTTSKGEIYELKQLLDSNDKAVKKDAVKRVIAAMTVGKDVEMLFVDVMKCMQTNDLEMKKLVYLYLINYAKLKSDLAILSTCSFTRDCADPNPLIRALALRTITCLRVESIIEYMCEPLQNALQDTDPYVRKTAVVCVAKIHELNPQLAIDYGLLEGLSQLLTDSNPMVVSNTIAVVTEILQGPNKLKDLIRINFDVIKKLLFSVTECSEWGQVYVLDFIATYTASNAQEATSICQRITACFAHANAAVVMSAIKVVMKNISMLEDDGDTVLLSKLHQPLIRLLSDKPEIQYVALRNIKLIIRKYPTFMRDTIRVFFVKYNDPLYIKMEKIDVMILVCDSSNVHYVIEEIRHYATEIDVDFVRRSIRAIASVAIKVYESADNCVKLLLELIETEVEYVVQMCIVVFMDIFRRYPNKYEQVLVTLSGIIEDINEPEAKAAMIWIIGEYAEKISNADELLDKFLEEFEEEPHQVQLQLLTASVKLFLRKPQQTQDLIQTALQLSTQENISPDLRDRGYIYWRLLSTDPDAAKEVVLKERPLISDDHDVMDHSLLGVLIANMSTLASVYHKHPSEFTDSSETFEMKFGSQNTPSTPPLSSHHNINSQHQGQENNQNPSNQQNHHDQRTEPDRARVSHQAPEPPSDDSCVVADLLGLGL